MNRIFVGLCRDELAIFSDWGSSDAETLTSMIKENCVVFSRSGKKF